MRVRCLLFAAAREATGTSCVHLDLPAGADTHTLTSELCQRCPQLAAILPHALLAVNREYVTEAVALKDGDEAAVIPPISGG
mmetsp:Transcript_25076/g.63035  ORF Transcript_25076/g.63035 Transcript_25076/m.63035 type:complete len:82 (-) Transcript_25076:579-824(-)